MMMPTFLQALSRALVIGAFGRAALVLTTLYSRRGPLIYPVYAAILVALTWSLSRAGALGFGGRMIAAFAAIGLSTVITSIAIVRRTARQRRELESLHGVAKGHIPVWALPLVVAVLATASAGVAFVSS